MGAWDVNRELFAAIRDEALPGRLVYYDAPTTADVSLASASRTAKQVEPLTPVARSSEPTT